MAATTKGVFDGVVAAIATNHRPLDFHNDPVDRHRGAFIRRRVKFLFTDDSTVGIDDDAVFIVRILGEYTLASEFVAVTVGSFESGIELDPPDLDLHDLAKSKATTAASIIESRAKAYLKRRVYWTHAIVWRALGIHDELWVESPTTGLSTIDKPALDSVLNRRLRLLERLAYQVGRSDESWSFQLGGVSGPWTDGFRNRVFELPEIPRTPKKIFKQVSDFLGPTNVADGPTPSGEPVKPWRRNWKRTQLLSNETPAHLGPHMAGSWVADQDPNYLTFVRKDFPLSDAVRRMFTPETDWWKRSWLPGEMVLTALHLEALLFARERRFGDVGESVLDAWGNATTPFVALGSFVGMKNGRLLAANGGEGQFENAEIGEDELQIGDHIRLFSSDVMDVVSETDPSVVEAIVVDVSSNESSGGIHRSTLRFQSPGSTEKGYGSYLKDELVSLLSDALDQVRELVRGAQNEIVLDWNGVAGALVRWDPYETCADPGAWWVRLPLTKQYTDIGDMARLVHGTVIIDLRPGTGYHPPPTTDAVYFPLFRPAKSTWKDYLDKRRTHSNTPPPKLATYPVDGSFVPGLYPDGKVSPIEVLRPTTVLTPI